MLRLPSALTPALAMLVLALAGCREPEIASYRVKKEPVPTLPPAAGAASARSTNDSAPVAKGGATAPVASAPAPAHASAAPSMANTPVSTAQGEGLVWQAPASWTSRPGSPMRKATYVIKGADGAEAELAITAFPGDVGGNLANVNRWRGQLQLAPITESELASVLTPLSANGLSLLIADLKGPAPKHTRVLGAIVPYNGSTWFFKLTGPDALLETEKPAFLSYLNTVRAP